MASSMVLECGMASSMVLGCRMASSMVLGCGMFSLSFCFYGVCQAEAGQGQPISQSLGGHLAHMELFGIHHL